MIWSTQTVAEYMAPKEKWHTWFAWKPVPVSLPNGHLGHAWLQVVERCGEYFISRRASGWRWRYRLIASGEGER